MTKLKTTTNEIPGVNVAGHLSATFGLGEAAKATVAAMKTAEIPLYLNNLSQASEARNESPEPVERVNPYPINLVCTNPDILEKLILKDAHAQKLFNPGYFQSRYNIGYWSWETPEIPENWLPALNLFDEIWTGSQYVAAAIRRCTNLPVKVFRFCNNFTPSTLQRKDLHLPEDKWLFLFVFDEYSNYQRKNPQAVIKAFCQSFGKEESGVGLLIKSRNLQPFQKQSLETIADNHPGISFINEDVSREALSGLIKNCDCYVSLHRSEGYGLTIVEAMYYGKPVIATNYSGNIDFMDAENTFPIDYEITTLAETSGVYKRGTRWAEPDVGKAAEAMRFVYEQKASAMKIGQRASRDIRRQLAPETIGRQIRKRLQEINELVENTADTTNEKNKRIEKYFRMIRRKQLKAIPWKIKQKFFS